MAIYRKPCVLVITATITPSSRMPGVHRADPLVRLQDYYQALNFYLSLPNHCIDRILFLENSDSDLSCLHQLVETNNADKQIEFISVSSDYQHQFGKGYGEFKMLDEGLARCSFISDTDVLWKLTGRLKIANLQQLIETSPQDYLFYCDLRSVPLIGDLLGGNEWMELRVFSCTVSAYNSFLRGKYDKFCYGVPEKYFFKMLEKELHHKNNKIVPRFLIQPLIMGYSGYSNLDYQSTGYKVKELVRKTARFITPWLWL